MTGPGFQLDGAAGDNAGSSVSGAGDIYDDGCDDLIVGANSSLNLSQIADNRIVSVEELQLTGASVIALSTIRVVAGPGNGVSRVVLSWPNSEIRNAWLQVTVKKNANTGIAWDDVFHFGNQVGDVFGATPNGDST